MKDEKIIAVVGMSGSGKSEVVDYLAEKGFPRVYFGGMVLKEMERRGIEITPENEKDFREKIRAEEGDDWVVRQAIQNIYSLLEAGQRNIVLDGVYSWTEYTILKREFPAKVIFAAVVVPKKTRFKRVAARANRPLTTEEIQERDRSEIENLEKGGPIAAADYYILNDGDTKDLREKVDAVLDAIEK